MSSKKSSDTLPFEKPTLRINAAELPEIKDWKIDQEYTLTVKAKMRGISKDQYSDDPKIWGTFIVQSVKSDGENDPLRKGMDSVPIKNVRK